MKKIVLLTSILCIVFLSGCKQDNSSEGTSHESNPSKVSSNSEISLKYLSEPEEEYYTLRAGGAENSMVFTLNSDDFSGVKHVDFWIDHYTKGQLKKGKSAWLSTDLNDSKATEQVTLYWSQINLNDAKTWKLSALIKDKNGYLMASSDNPVSLVDDLGQTFTPLNPESIQINEATDLGIITLDTEGMVYQDDAQETIKQNDEVYVLRMKLS